ncbi:MAG: hypothetical protein O7B81_10335, partial [Gammaproteobacteria bacterium]|nr:hypothetical protein [Gammaproteobacteria bacterium]
MLLKCRKSLFSAIGAAITAGLLASPPAAAETPVRGGTLNVGFPSDTKTLDPMFSVQFTERQVLYLVY